MATPIHPLIFINFKPHYSPVTLFIISFYLMNFNALGGKITFQSEYDTFDVNSFLPPSCQPFVQGHTRPASLKLTHLHGPCSISRQSDTKKVTSLREVLTRDQNRVGFIQNHHAFNAIEESKVTISATSISGTIGNAYYVVSVGLGTPAKYISLAIDTGSSLSWTQCKPCTGHCYKQKDPIFDPSASTSYHNVSCEAAECSQLSDNPVYKRYCASSTCTYGTTYGNRFVSNGFLANERLTLTAHDVFDNIPLGCGQDNHDLYGESAGLLGLGRELLSVVSGTAEKYGHYFSYCLPTKSGSNGHLTFGKSATRNHLVFTPFANASSPYYFVNIVAISVAGRQLPISSSIFHSGRTIIDSGTVITRLAPTAYTALRAAFRQQMSKYKLAPAVSILDTCYDLKNQTNVTIPKVSFFFAGNAKVDLGSKGVFLNKGKFIFCLAFAANKADKDLGIFGNVQQQTFEVAYDIAGGILGFSPDGCS